MKIYDFHAVILNLNNYNIDGTLFIRKTESVQFNQFKSDNTGSIVVTLTKVHNEVIYVVDKNKTMLHK